MRTSALESVQDFLIKLDIKPIMHLLEISTGKSLPEALFLASTNPQYDDRLFIELQVQYMKIPSSEQVVYINCFQCQNKN